MKIALVSLDSAWLDMAANLEKCEICLKNISGMVDLAIFPEMMLTGFSTNLAEIPNENEVEGAIKTLKNLAKKYNIALIFGAALKRERAQNLCIALDEKGCEIARYAKIHPFSKAGEDVNFEPGKSLEIAKIAGHKIALSICYDLRFPELYRAYADNCDIMLNIASWPASRLGHWSALLKARAIENQTFMIGLNRTGKDGNGLEYALSSGIYNANGDFLESIDSDIADCALLDSISIFELDKSYTENYKKDFDTLKDRRKDMADVVSLRL